MIAFAIFMSCPTRRRPMGKNSIIITSDVIPSCIGQMLGIPCQPFGKIVGVMDDLGQRSDIKDVIQWPIQSCFRLRRPAIMNNAFRLFEVMIVKNFSFKCLILSTFRIIFVCSYLIDVCCYKISFIKTQLINMRTLVQK
jgi:hypothetical protein